MTQKQRLREEAGQFGPHRVAILFSGMSHQKASPNRTVRRWCNDHAVNGSQKERDIDWSCANCGAASLVPTSRRSPRNFHPLRIGDRRRADAAAQCEGRAVRPRAGHCSTARRGQRSAHFPRRQIRASAPCISGARSPWLKMTRPLWNSAAKTDGYEDCK